MADFSAHGILTLEQFLELEPEERWQVRLAADLLGPEGAKEVVRGYLRQQTAPKPSTFKPAEPPAKRRRFFGLGNETPAGD
jgi:hypothetical protein